MWEKQNYLSLSTVPQVIVEYLPMRRCMEKINGQMNRETIQFNLTEPIIIDYIQYSVKKKSSQNVTRIGNPKQVQ